MSQPDPESLPPSSPSLRSDALISRERILAAAATLAGDRRVSMSEIAAAACVGRSTLYRHFPSREALETALESFAPARSASAERGGAAGGVVPLSFQAPGQLGREAPLTVEVTRVLDEVPPHLVPDQLVAEARRASGVGVALYVIDIDGSHLLRLAGSPEFPDRIDDPPALGPELIPEGLHDFYGRLAGQLPGCTVEPLWLRGRIIGLLLCLGQPVSPLADIAKQGAAALELAGDYTDFIETARRRKPTTAAAEIQQNLFPPRIARIAGAQLAGVLLPSYEVGGDWFDFVENRDGAWLAIADAAGKGPTAAGLGAAALGALRAARRDGADLKEVLSMMDRTVRALGNDTFHVTALLARWHAAHARLTWVNCGNPPAFLVDEQGEMHELDSPNHPPLGRGAEPRTFEPVSRQLRPGERLILVTDGIVERHIETGGTFGEQGLRRALERVQAPTAAYTALAIQEAVTSCWTEPLEDDATAVVMAVS
jgi:serine phosphatase RsbU (regulator of sigma subunit)